MKWPLCPVVICTALSLAAATATGAQVVPDTPTTPDAPGPPPFIAATGVCPGAETVWGALATLVSRDRLYSLPGGTPQIEVADLGDSYRVRVVAASSRRERVYRDLTRDCEQRARFAAVFIVLTLMPPELLVERPPEAIASPPSPALPSPPTALGRQPSQRPIRIEVGALMDLAPPLRSAPEMMSLGGELRVSIGSSLVAGVLAVAVLPRTTFTVAELRGRQDRIPIDVGVRLRRVLRVVELAVDVGLMGAILRVEGISPTTPKQETGFDLGGRLGVGLRLGRGARVAPVVGIHCAFFPSPYQLATTPQGVLGNTPSLWLGATVGLSAAF
jgi:hypothetical protein